MNGACSIMRKLLFYLTLLSLCGCQTISNLGSQSSSSSDECPEVPEVELNPKDVQEIELSNQMIPKSGIAKKTKSVGFTFEAKEGQKFDYKTEDNICVWIYTPDNEQLNSKNLPKTGKYTIQISAPKGSQTFELAMGLDVDTNSSSNSTSVPSASLSQKEAVNLIKNWQRAKRKIFAPPFDRQLGGELLTGEAYRKNVGAVDSSIAWLSNNNAYYTYRLQTINNVEYFSQNNNNASIQVVTREQRTLCLNGRPSRDNNTIDSTSKVSYYLRFDNSKWKIENYNTTQSISKRPNPNTSCRIEY